MHQAGVQTRKFYEILQGMEGLYAGAECLAKEAMGWSKINTTLIRIYAMRRQRMIGEI